MSAAVSHSLSTNVNFQDNQGIIVTWTGTSPVGVLTFEVSNDGLTWVALDFGTPIAISGNSGNHLVNINQISCSNLRATYTKTSGTGVLLASLTSKQCGG